MPEFVKSVTGRPKGVTQSVAKGHIFDVPVGTSLAIGLADGTALNVDPNDPNTLIIVWEELPAEPARNLRWFLVTGLQAGNILVEAKRGSDVASFIQIAVSSTPRLPWVDLFLTKTQAKAFALCCKWGISMPALLGQSAHESQWGKSPLCIRNNVWFGVTAAAGAPDTIKAGGRTFRAYLSFDAAADDYIRVVQTIYPAAWAVRGDTERYIDTLGLVYDPATKDAYPTAWRNMLRDGRLRDFEAFKKACK